MNRGTQQDTSLVRTEGGIPTWSPVREFADLRRQMDDLFSRAFGYTPLSALIPGPVSNGPHSEADIYETDDKVIVLCPLPGFESNQIDVQATEGTITIRAERTSLMRDNNARQYRHGHMSSADQFQATYSLPDEIDPNKINATFKNGVLRIEAPKSERARHKAVKVNVKS